MLPNSAKSGLTNDMLKALDHINSNNEMIIEEPTALEKAKIRTKFKYTVKKMSHYDIMIQIFKELNIDKKHHEKLFKITQQFEMLDSDFETLKEFITDNSKYLIEK